MVTVDCVKIAILREKSMLEILQYIFSSFWIFCGVVILLYTIGAFCITAPIAVIASIFNKEENKKENDNV